MVGPRLGQAPRRRKHWREDPAISVGVEFGALRDHRWKHAVDSGVSARVRPSRPVAGPSSPREGWERRGHLCTYGWSSPSPGRAVRASLNVLCRADGHLDEAAIRNLRGVPFLAWLPCPDAQLGPRCPRAYREAAACPLQTGRPGRPGGDGLGRRRAGAVTQRRREAAWPRTFNL